MAVIRRQNTETPGGGEVPSGPDGGSTPPAPVDRTKSVVKPNQSTRSAAARQGQRGPGRAGTAAGKPLTTSTDARSFFGDMITELKRVVWPTRDEVQSGTIITVALLVFFSLYIFVLDMAVEKLFNLLGFYS